MSRYKIENKKYIYEAWFEFDDRNRVYLYAGKMYRNIFGKLRRDRSYHDKCVCCVVTSDGYGSEDIDFLSRSSDDVIKEWIYENMLKNGMFGNTNYDERLSVFKCMVEEKE